MLLETGPVAARYFEESAGVRWKIVQGFPDYHHPHAPGTVGAGRYHLETELFDGATLGDWQKRTYLSPHMPNGITHDELFAWGGFVNVMKWDFAAMGKRYKQDQRGFGPGMMAYFVKAAMIDRAIPAHLETPARALLVEDGAVVGVRAERGGKDFLVRAKKGVLLAAGGYDWNPEMARWFELLPEWQSMVQPSVAGDAMTMGCEIGAAVAAVPAFNLGLFFGYRVPGEEHDGKPLWRGSWEGGFPHAIWVNKRGERFADESFYRDYLPKTRAWDGVKQEHPNFPPFLVFDSNYRAKYPLGTVLPVQDFPPGLVETADTLREPRGEQLGTSTCARPRAHGAALQRARGGGRGPRLPPRDVPVGRDDDRRPHAQEPQPRAARQGALLRAPAPRRERRDQRGGPAHRRGRPGDPRPRPPRRGPLRRGQQRRAARHRRRLPERPVEPPRHGARLPRGPPRRAVQR